MSKFKMPRTSKYPDYPDNDKDRLDIIFDFLKDQSPSNWFEISSLLRHNLQWSVEDSDKYRLEDLLITSGLVNVRQDILYKMIQLYPSSRITLHELHSYSNYLNREMELESSENETEELNKKLTKAQLDLVILQKRELKTKRIWATIGVIGGAILTYVLDHLSDIWNTILKAAHQK